MKQKLLRFVPIAGKSPGGSAGRRVLQALVLIMALLFPSHQAKAEQWGDQHITINTDNFEQYGYFDVTFEAFYKYWGLSADDAKNKYGSARIRINDKYVAFITGSQYPYCLSERTGKQPYSDRAVLHVEKSSTDVAEVRVIKKITTRR